MIISALKPVTEVRMYFRFAQSLQNDHEIHLIGTEAESYPSSSRIFLHPLWQKTQTWKNRIRQPLKLWSALKVIRPTIVIITTPEHLIPLCIFKYILKFKLVYDIQENYLRNLIFHPHYPILARHFIGYAVRCIEFLSVGSIDHYILAEKHYSKEFSFHKKKFTLLENKYFPIGEYSLVAPSRPNTNCACVKVVISGTFSTVFGTYDAIKWAKFMVKRYFITVSFVGWAAEKNLLTALEDLVNEHHGKVFLIGGRYHVPHTTIMRYVTNADVALLPYELKNPSTQYCIPSKMYECLATATPMLVSANPFWIDFLSEYEAGIFLDFKNEDTYEQSWELFLESTFYKSGSIKEAFWQKESGLLTRLVNDLS